ncbi:hypothetical protein V494_07925, partial [Pseudogymnoascus sp. VKM F-4513 (FW-928)]
MDVSFGAGRGGRVEEQAPASAPAPQEPPAPQPAPAPAPEAPTPTKSATFQLAKKYSCHICRFINEEIERCAACGHRLCIDCEWLMPIARTDGAFAQREFAIYEDDDARHVEMEIGRQRAESVYTPSEFEQENYVDREDTPDLPPRVWAQQAALAKAHYTTPQSPTVGSHQQSQYSTTQQSPSIASPPPSPIDLSHLSASDYPGPLRVAHAPSSSPIRPPGPKGRRVVRDNPFVVADQLSVAASAGARMRRGRGRGTRGDSGEGGVGSRDGQSSPLPGRFVERNLGSGERAEGVGMGAMWQTNRIPLPGLAVVGGEDSEKIPVERATVPI